MILQRVVYRDAREHVAAFGVDLYRNVACVGHCRQVACDLISPNFSLNRSTTIHKAVDEQRHILAVGLRVKLVAGSALCVQVRGEHRSAVS